MLKKKGYISVSAESVSEEDLLEVALDAGAEDLKTEGDRLAIYTSYEDFYQVRTKVEEANIPIESGELTMLPQNAVVVEGKQAEKTLKLMEALEEQDDVQSVYGNFDIDEKEMEALLN